MLKQVFERLHQEFPPENRDPVIYYDLDAQSLYLQLYCGIWNVTVRIEEPELEDIETLILKIKEVIYREH